MIINKKKKTETETITTGDCGGTASLCERVFADMKQIVAYFPVPVIFRR